MEIKPTCKGVTTGKHNASRALLAFSGGSSVITILQKEIKKAQNNCSMEDLFHQAISPKEATSYLRASTRCSESSAETLKLPSPVTTLWYMWKRPSKYPQSFCRQSTFNYY